LQFFIGKIFDCIQIYCKKIFTREQALKEQADAKEKAKQKKKDDAALAAAARVISSQKRRLEPTARISRPEPEHRQTMRDNTDVPDPKCNPM